MKRFEVLAGGVGVTRLMFRRSLLIVSIVSFLVGLGASAAYAAIASGPSQYSTVYGRSYGAYSMVDNSQHNARVVAQVTAGSPAPAGYIGVQPWLYRDTSVCRAANTSYNTGLVTTFSAITDGVYCGSGNYRGVGTASYYNGGPYYNIGIPFSPYLGF